jgi:ubiquinone/menaquinone biosynthesis C-methylase UbiE
VTGDGDPIVAFFERHPRWYDLQLPLERRALRAAAALAEPLAGARVIDLAAGTGGLSAAILRRARTIASLAAVDASPRMLERAHARLRRVGASPAFVVADARSVPMADGCADVVAIGYLLHLLDPGARAEVVGETHRLLAPGGLLVAIVHGSPGGRAGRIYRGAWGLLRRLLPWAFVGGGPMTDLAPAIAAAGFEVEASRWVPGVYWSQVVRARRPAAPDGLTTPRARSRPRRPAARR